MHLIKGDRSDDILLNYSSNSEQPMPLIVSQIFYLIGEFLSPIYIKNGMTNLEIPRLSVSSKQQTFVLAGVK